MTRQPASPADDSEIPGDGDAGAALRTAVWSAFAGLAFLVFELTADPVVAVAAFCLRFAVRDVVIALRLVTLDPAIIRGATCALFHLSLGAMKALGTSLVAAFVVGVIFRQGFRLQGVARGQAWQTTEALLWIAIWSWAAAVFVSLLGTLIAWQAEIKVWLSSATLQALGTGRWPPRPQDPRNRLSRVVAIELTAVVVIAFAVLIVVLTRPAMLRRPAAPGVLAGIFGGLIGGLLPVALAVLVLWLGGRIRQAIEAGSPEECWPDDGPSAGF